MKTLIALSFVAAALLNGCGSSAQFAAIPSGLDRNAVPHQAIEVTAHRYEFIPAVIRVRAGTLVALRVTSTDGTHGFSLDAFGIDEEIDERSLKVIEFFAERPGEYDFHCSHFCGIGHFGMTGKVVVF